MHEGHLAEAVRRGVITVDQMEAVLAIARSEASPNAVELPDLRWTAVVLGVSAAVAVLVPGLTLFARAREFGAAGAIGGCLAGFGACVGLGWLARLRGWGRVPASVLTAGAAPYAGGLAMFAVDRVWFQAMTGDAMGHWGTRDHVFGALFFLAIAVTSGVVALLWRAQRNGPALAVAGFCGSFAVMTALASALGVRGVQPQTMSVVASAVALLALVRWRRAWLRRDGVDGAAWFELGLFAAGGIAATARSADLREAFVWPVVALVVAAVGVGLRRWTYQLCGALGVLWFTGFGMWGEPITQRALAMVVAVVMIAFGAQWQRRRVAERAFREDAPEALSYWA